jgi:signal transduction histidine kinase/CheY-like chemotaxis protein/HAMP domain-containing protein
MTIRAKLFLFSVSIAGAFLALIVTGVIVSSRNQEHLAAIRERYLPKLEHGPRLQAAFDKLARTMQDAVAAQDRDQLELTRTQELELLEQISSKRSALDAAKAAGLREAVEGYYRSAYDVARRMLDGESGPQLLERITEMQTRKKHATQLLQSATEVDRVGLRNAFDTIVATQAAGRDIGLFVGGVCMLVVLLLSLWASGSLLRSLSQLSEGFDRFGRGDFSQRIASTGRDELDALAGRANQMAEGLHRLGMERDRADWMKAGHAGLSHELRGELTPWEVADRSIRFLASYLGAPAAAFYLRERDGTLILLGQHSTDAGDAGVGVKRFAPGEGVVGRAALQRELIVIDDVPDDHMRIRSGLGESAPRVLLLVPVIHLDQVRGVIELAFFRPAAEHERELLASLSETLALALEAARSRASTRELLIASQAQATRLTAQEEELRTTNEALRSQREELETKQEALEKTNVELIHQSDELRAQQQALERANDELREARERMQDKAEELATVSAYKSQFLANMSHELRTPLNSMLLLSDLLAQNDNHNLSEKQVEFCRTIHGAGEDLLALINQVLDLAKIESGKQSLQLDSVELQAVCARAERIFGPLVRDKGLELHVAILPGTPATITSDKQRIEQILDNLLGNAIKFTEAGSVSLEVGSAAGGVAFRVVDTGIGIAPEQQDRIFAPFEQVDAKPDRRYGGTGLGLAIARELARVLGGRLTLESALGRGSTFTCQLPSIATQAVEAEARVSHTSAAAAPRSARGDCADPRSEETHLLVIEDDLSFAEAVGEVIRKQGFKYVVAPDAARGLELAKQYRPNGILLDVKLPDRDGFSLLRSLRADPATADIPVHFVSAVDDGRRGMAMGAIGYLTKPASQRDLERVLKTLLRPRAERHRILVVESDPDAATSLVSKLRGDEMEARAVTTAQAAFELLRVERFACMILDLDVDGLALLHRLKDELEADAPAVIVHTARPLNEAEASWLETYAEATVMNDGPEIEPLLDEVRSFMQRLKHGPPANDSMASIPLRLDGRKLLLVDDDMRNLYALSALLRAKGAEVLIADNGRAALDQLALRPDVELVLMDMMMPEMDGYEAIQRIRRDPRFARLPIVALTAKAMKGDREKCVEIGATDYLAKPVDAKHLAALLREHLSQPRSKGA